MGNNWNWRRFTLKLGENALTKVERVRWSDLLAATNGKIGHIRVVGGLGVEFFFHKLGCHVMVTLHWKRKDLRQRVMFASALEFSGQLPRPLKRTMDCTFALKNCSRPIASVLLTIHWP